MASRAASAASQPANRGSQADRRPCRTETARSQGEARDAPALSITRRPRVSLWRADWPSRRRSNLAPPWRVDHPKDEAPRRNSRSGCFPGAIARERRLSWPSDHPARAQISPHLVARPGEVRQAQWPEIDFDNSVWRIPATRMKMRRPHAVPLSRQVKAYWVRGSLPPKERVAVSAPRTTAWPPPTPLLENAIAGFVPGNEERGGSVLP
jgi:hypothetical protein